MKKVGFLTLLITGMLLLARAFPAAASGPKTPTAVPAAVVAAPVPPPHPRIHEAIEMMHGAKEKLEHAEGNFHGRREKAIEHLEKAMHEAEEAEHMP